MKRSSAADADLPPPGWKRNPILLAARGVDEVLSSHLSLAARETAPLAKYRHILAYFELSAHSAIWFGGITFLTWFFAFDVAVRTFLLNVSVAFLVDVGVTASLRVWQLGCEDEPSSTRGLPSNFTSRTVLVTLVLAKRGGLLCVLQVAFIVWGVAMAVTKTLLGKNLIGDFVMGGALGYLEYQFIVQTMWLSEGAVSAFFNVLFALEEPTHDSLLW